jgi:hypothetical protein
VSPRIYQRAHPGQQGAGQERKKGKRGGGEKKLFFKKVFPIYVLPLLESTNLALN